MFEALRRYADFSGRSRRREFWLFILFQWLVNVGLIILLVGVAAALGQDVTAGRPSDEMESGAFMGVIAFSVAMVLFWLATIVPSCAVAARRMQDQDIPGWVGILLVLTGWLFWPLPFLVMAVFGFIPGTAGPNKYGPDPRIDNQADIFA